MFGLSFGEILLILVVALLVLGPERLPKVARTVGRGMRELRRATGDFREVVESELLLDEPDERPRLQSASPVIRPATAALPAAAEEAAGQKSAPATKGEGTGAGAAAPAVGEGAAAPVEAGTSHAAEGREAAPAATASGKEAGG